MTEPKSAIQPKPTASAKGSVSTPSGWNPFDSLRTEIDRLFDDFHPFELAWPGSRQAPRSVSGASWALSPAMDMVEHADEFEITAELPGIDEKNIEIKLLRNAIVIRGEKREEHEEKKKGLSSLRKTRWFLPTQFPYSGGSRSGKDRSRVFQGYSDVAHSEVAGGEKLGKKNRNQGSLRNNGLPAQPGSLGFQKVCCDAREQGGHDA